MIERICKYCGGMVKFDGMSKTTICPTCETVVSFKNDTISKYILNARISQLKLMHQMMIYANNEEIYATWIVNGVPDEPMEDDFEFIARDEKSYNECFDLFVKLIKLKDFRY